MRTIILVGLGYGLLLIGLFMALAPLMAYQLIPGIEESGPFNSHLVRDVGCVYTVTGASLLWLMRDPRAWPAALAGGLFLSLHALVHIWGWVILPVVLEILVFELVAVFLPAGLVLWLALTAREPG